MTRINTTDADMAEPNEIIEAPPGMMDAILKAIAELDIATHADIVGINQRLDTVYSRVETVETAIAELPAKYASADSLNRITSSQAEYEARSRKLTEQVGNLVNVQADSQAKFTSIEARLNDLSTMKNLLTDFMNTQRERLDNQQATITEVRRKTETLSGKVAFVETTQVDAEQRYNTGFKPVHDFIIGSETQKPLITIIDGIKSTLTTQGQTLQPVADYVMAQKAKEAARVSFRQRVWLQLFTKTGFALMIFSVLLLIILVQSIDLERSFNWIRQLAAAFGFKAG